MRLSPLLLLLISLPAAALAIAAGCAPDAPTVVVSAGQSATAPCASGRADCDGDPRNGCERSLSSPDSCGACNVHCGARESCVDGLCRREHRLHAETGACAIRGGAVHCWGPTPAVWGLDLLFEGRRADTVPRRFEGVDDALAVRFSASDSFLACAVRRSGGATCWPETPKPLVGQTGLRDVAVDGFMACVVSTTGHLRCGTSNLADVPGIRDAIAVVASKDVFFALRESGQVVQVEPKADGFEITPVDGITDAVDVASAYGIFCALRRSGKVACPAPVTGPAPSPSTAKRPFVDVPGLTDAVDIDIDCAVRATGEAVSWSRAGGAATPIAGVKDARSIACRDDYGCYERADGAVLCWGSRRGGKLGDGAETTYYEPIPVDGITDAKAVVAGTGACVLRKNGQVWCWGRADERSKRRGAPAEQVPGIDGASSIAHDGDNVCVTGPGKPVSCFRAVLPSTTEVTTFEGLGDVTKAIVASRGVGVALRASGEVVLFDGRGKGTSRPAPVELPGVRDAADIALSAFLVCVLRKGGSVACAKHGDAAPASPGAAPKLVEVSGLRDATQLSGSTDVCAVRRSGAAVCVVESHASGTTRAGFVTANSRFGALGGLTRIVEGAGSSCVITARGEVMCLSWMHAMIGGTGLAERASGKAPVKGVSNAVDVSSGFMHACAVLATGSVVCWGSNEGDALGGGESPISMVPIEVPLGGAPSARR